jgi:Ca-activated chloride channel family protein
LAGVANNGRNIYVSLFARSLENPLHPESPWPGADGSVMRGPVSGVSYQPELVAGGRERLFNTEEYAHEEENPFRDTVLSPLSTVSIDVDTASYANLRRFLQRRLLPPVGAVRLEEMINYFRYDYPVPDEENVPLAFATEYANCPWNSDHRLLRIGMQGRHIPLEDLPPNNLVFLTDVSGSMDDPHKLPLLVNAMELLVDQLRPEDRVAIVVYAGAAGLALPSTSGGDKQTIRQALGRLRAGGSTAGGAGIQLAYEVAQASYRADANNRVILATDGDFNIGVSNESELTRMIEEKRKTGIYLSVLGFGTGNYKDTKMESLADHGNGNYAYIDSLREAQKVLVREMGSTLFAIANDVKVQVEFNPFHAKAYRLLGYENRTMAAEEFADDTRDAGELGAGHTVTFLYEIVPPGAPEAAATTALRYQATDLREVARTGEELGAIHVCYKLPGEDTSRLLTRQIPAAVTTLGDSTPDFRFAAAVAEWALLLGDSSHRGEATYEQVRELAACGLDPDPHGDRTEFTQLVLISQSLAEAAAARAARPEPVAGPDAPDPHASPTFTTSTEFLEWIVQSGTMNVGYDFFCHPGKTDWSRNSAALDSRDNIWCVSMGINDATPEGTPVLFTRNITATNLSQLTGRIRDHLDDSPPFGKESLVMILNNGTALILTGRDLRRTWEDVLGGASPPLGVLRP